MPFDARTAKLLPTGQNLTFLEHPGLRLEASNKFKSWVYRYKSPVDGRMRQVQIGRWPSVSYASAVVAWEKMRKDRDAGVDLSAKRREERTATKSAMSYTIADLCNDYWAGHVKANRKQKGATEIRRLFDKMPDDMKRLPASTLTRKQAFDFLQSYAVVTPVLAGQLRSELGAAWDYAIDSGSVPDETPNWWRRIMRGRIKSKGKKINGEHIGTAKRVLTDAEVGTLIRWLPNLSQTLEDALTLYLWTGCRGAEIVQAEGCEVRQEETGWWWVIPKAKTKNASVENATDMRVPLFGRALSVMQRRKERHGNGFLFQKRGGCNCIEQKTIQSSIFYFQPYCQTRPEIERPRLPVSNWAPHDLRRTVRTMLSSLGCPDEIGEAIVGHVKAGVVGVYNLYGYDKERREWLGRLSDYLERLATQP